MNINSSPYLRYFVSLVISILLTFSLSASQKCSIEKKDLTELAKFLRHFKNTNVDPDALSDDRPVFFDADYIQEIVPSKQLSQNAKALVTWVRNNKKKIEELKEKIKNLNTNNHSTCITAQEKGSYTKNDDIKKKIHIYLKEPYTKETKAKLSKHGWTHTNNHDNITTEVDAILKYIEKFSNGALDKVTNSMPEAWANSEKIVNAYKKLYAKINKLIDNNLTFKEKLKNNIEDSTNKQNQKIDANNNNLIPKKKLQKWQLLTSLAVTIAFVSIVINISWFLNQKDNRKQKS